MKKSFKYGLIMGIIIALALVYYSYPKNLSKNDEVVIEDKSINDLSKDIEIEENTDSVDSTEIDIDENQELQKEKLLPANKKLEVAFIPQAPYHDWSEPWQNACEEAALLTLYHYIKGDKEVSAEQVKQEILAMLAWQDKYFGSHKDLKASEIATMAEKYLGYKNVQLTYDIKIEDIKEEIAQGRPVLIPAAGRVLDNPNFTSPGPIYHNVVVIGYTENKIVTNDPGTRLGADFEYSYENFYDSIHDYVEGAKQYPEKMLEGRKVMIVINE